MSRSPFVRTKLGAIEQRWPQRHKTEWIVGLELRDAAQQPAGARLRSRVSEPRGQLAQAAGRQGERGGQ